MLLLLPKMLGRAELELRSPRKKEIGHTAQIDVI